jgi:hypothetical protein
VGYNYTTKKVEYNAHVKVGTYLGIGYGDSMGTAAANVDMVAWEAGSTVALSLVQDLYGAGEINGSKAPLLSASNSYTTTSTTLKDGFIDFVTYRPLAPTSGGNVKYVIPLGT